MAMTLIHSESDLINEIKHSAPYKRFQSQHFKIKVQREQKAWELLKANKRQYSRKNLEEIFDIVDQEGGKSRWFGSLLGTPNRNLIFQTPIGQVSNWIDYVCFSGLDAEVILNNCLDQMKIKGASKGLATLLLYLSDPSKYAIWVNRTYEGLDIIDRMKEKKSGWGAKYAAFNSNALEFAHVFSFDYRELDWVLSFIGSYVTSNGSNYEIDEDVLGSSTVPVAVSDEEDDDEIDDMVGEPMELGVMRWTPTNEMGVVALFIEYRRELGFPIVEFIRPQFPDAAVFEQDGKKYVRRYIEFEYRSKGYRSHLNSSRKCHYVVCWEHDWKECPLPVIELKKEVPQILKKRLEHT